MKKQTRDVLIVSFAGAVGGAVAYWIIDWLCRNFPLN